MPSVDHPSRPNTAGNAPPANITTTSKLPSIASSEYYSRLEALELQLQEERKRRLHVEQTIKLLKRESPAQPPDAQSLPANPQSVLTELSLFLHQQQRTDGSSRSSLRSAVSSRRAADGSEGRVSHSSPKAKATRSVPRPPLLCPRAPDAAAESPWRVEKHVKPPLPTQAKGTRNSDATPNRFAKKRASGVDVYLTQQRHEERMQHLANFQLSPF